MKANPEKCHFICSTDDKVNIILKYPKILKYVNSPCQKLTFYDHINDICKNAGFKLYTLARITPCLDLNEKRLLLNAFFMSQFNCAS